MARLEANRAFVYSLFVDGSDCWRFGLASFLCSYHILLSIVVARRTRSPSTAVAMRRIRAAADAITQKQKDEEKETEAAAEAAKESEEKEKARRKQAAQTRWEKLRKYVKNGALLARLFRVDPFALMRAKSKNRQSRQLLIDPSVRPPNALRFSCFLHFCFFVLFCFVFLGKHSFV